jgi:phosphoglycolate phosphatase-like HAD superfamily hydrolase
VLVLFDIDGTLVHGRPEGHTRAMTDAMRAVWGVPATPDDVWRVHPAGRTDREIARLVLRGHGVPDADIDAGTWPWMSLACDLHAEAAHLHAPPAAAPDARAVAQVLAREGAELALVTGNLEAIGRAKVAAAGLGDLFADGRGGFGSDSEVRADLVRLARERAAGVFPDAQVVVVGDTPRDVMAARAAGVRVIAVATGAHDAAALADADAVVPDLTGALAVLRD